MELREIPIEQIREPTRDSRFYRDELWEFYLAEDIEIEGLRIPIIVRPIENNMYEIVEGVSRFRALKREGAKTIRADVQDVSDTDALVLRIKMNTMRKGACYIAMAQDFAELLKKGWRVKDIVERFHIGKSWVSKILALNKLNEEDKLHVAKGDLSVSNAYSLTRQIRRNGAQSQATVKCDCCNKPEKASLVSYRKLCMQCDALLQQAHERALKHAKDKRLTTF